MSDTIEFECPYCEKRSTVPASYAGKRGACPKCKKVIEVPDPDEGEQEQPAVDSDSGYASAAPGNETKACPMCGETIKKVAKKCKHCKSVLDKRLKGRTAASRFGQDVSKSEQPPSTADWLLVALCPGIGCIIGIVALIQGYTKRGGLMVGISVAWSFALNVLLAMIGGGSRY